MKRILFVGLGSAGQRHLRNLSHYHKDEFEFLAYRSSNRDNFFDENLNIISGRRIRDAYPVREFYDYDEALREKPEIVFICNPNSQHIPYSIKAASIGADLFIEKPLSSKQNDVDELNNIIKNKKLVAYVGFQNRLHPCVIKLKEILDGCKYGRVMNVYAEVGELLTKMHHNQDYRTLNEARSEFGGGVVSCQVHELDIIIYLFGLPESVYSVGGTYSSLHIDVEDTATSILKYCDCEKKEFSVTVHQDFMQFPPCRKLRIVFENARVEIDLLDATLTVYCHNGKIKTMKFKYQRNDLFVKEEDMFFDSVKSRERPFVSLEDGINTLILTETIKKSIKSTNVEKVQR